MVITKRTRSVSGSSNFGAVSVNMSCTTPGNIRYDHRNYTGGWLAACIPLGDSYWGHINVPDVEARCLDVAWTSCLANRGSGSANFSESLAELDQAGHMLRNPLENVHSFNESFRNAARARGNASYLAGVLGVWQFASSEWLRYRYGLSPLIADAKAALKAWRKTYKPIVERHTSRASGSIVNTKSEHFSVLLGLGSVGVNQFRRTDYSVRATFLDEYATDQWTDLGLTYVNLIGLPWELTRLSFVSDWFINIGDLIYANIPRPTYRPLGGCFTILRKTSSDWTCSGWDSTNPLWNVSGAPSDTVATTTETKERRPNSDTHGSLAIKTDFRFDNLNRVADLTALIIQQISRMSFIGH
jgi:hypothetical protein